MEEVWAINLGNYLNWSHSQKIIERPDISLDSSASTIKMDCSSDYGTPLYSYHPYKKISANRSTERITGRGSKVFQTQQTKEVMPLISLLFGKNLTGA